MAPKSKVVEYVSKQRRQSFKVPMRDEDGKQIPMLDGHGRPIYVLNKQQFALLMVELKKAAALVEEVHATKKNHITNLGSTGTHPNLFREPDQVSV